MFSKACEYGIMAMTFIASQSREGKRSDLKLIAEAIDSPAAFTAKILQALARADLIKSIKGPKGGYQIDPKKFEKIRLIDIVNTLDGNQLFQGCALGFKNCNDIHPCPVHFEIVKIKDTLRKTLNNVTILHLVDGIADGKTFFKYSN